MKNLRSYGIQALLCLGLVVEGTTGCGTWVPNPTGNSGGKTQNTVQLNFVSQSQMLQATTIPIVDVNGDSNGSLVLSSLSVSVKSIKINGSDGTVGAEFAGPFQVDLLNGTSDPEPTGQTIAAGSYSHVSLSFNAISEDDFSDLDDDLIGHSVAMDGVWTSASGDSRNVSLRISIDDEITLPNSGTGFDIVNLEESLIVAFSPGAWLSFNQGDDNEQSVDFSSLAAEGDIVLDETSEGTNLLVREVIEELIETSMDHGIDSDGDGSLSEDEDEFDDDD